MKLSGYVYPFIKWVSSRGFQASFIDIVVVSIIVSIHSFSYKTICTIVYWFHWTPSVKLVVID